MVNNPLPCQSHKGVFLSPSSWEPSGLSGGKGHKSVGPPADSPGGFYSQDTPHLKIVASNLWNWWREHLSSLFIRSSGYRISVGPPGSCCRCLSREGCAGVPCDHSSLRVLERALIFSWLSFSLLWRWEQPLSSSSYAECDKDSPLTKSLIRVLLSPLSKHWSCLGLDLARPSLSVLVWGPVWPRILISQFAKNPPSWWNLTILDTLDVYS